MFTAHLFNKQGVEVLLPFLGQLCASNKLEQLIQVVLFLFFYGSMLYIRQTYCDTECVPLLNKVETFNVLSCLFF